MIDTTNTRVNDDFQYSILNSNTNMNTRFSGRTMLSGLKKTPQLDSIKNIKIVSIAHRKNSKTLMSSKNVIPPFIDGLNTEKKRIEQRTRSLKLSTSSKSRNELHSVYQTLNSNLTTCVPHSLPSTTNNLNTKRNEINFKDRRLIRQATKRFKSMPSHDQDDIDSFNQLTQFKTNDINTFNPLSNNDARPSSVSRNIAMPLTEADIIYTERTPRTNYYCKRELKRLMETNPYHSLKNNFKYAFNQNQLVYAKNSQLTHRLLNYSKSKTNNAIYKINTCSTLFVKKETVKGDLIQRLIKRKSNLHPELKSVIFWKGIKWLWTTYSVQIKKLLFSFMNFKWFIDKGLFLSQKGINELFSLIQINKANDFSEALFLVYNENKSLHINMKIVINVFIATKQCSFKEKIQETMNVWAVGEDEAVKLAEIVEFAQLIFPHKRDVKKLAELIRKALDIRNLSTAIVNKHTFCLLCLKDEQINCIIKRNKIDLNHYEQVFENEIMNMYNINTRNSKGFIEVNDAQRQCEKEIMNYDKLLAIIIQCKDDRSDLNQRVLSEQEDVY